ncbi:unnamed protein product [Diamesa hyperborea]
MKFFKFLFVILTFIKIVKALEVNCGFSKHSDGYNCQALAFKVNQPNMTITGVKGNHMTGSKNNDVEVLYVTSNYQMDYLPIGLSSVFPNLNKFDVQTTSLEYISKASFKGLNNLKSINFLSGEIEVIPGDTFSELIYLQTLNLRSNKIQKFEEETFSSLENLKFLYLHENKIFMIQSKLLINNVNLDTINLSNNYIRIIGSNLLTNLNNLRFLNFEGNVCINKNLKNGFNKTEITKELMNKCSDPYEEQVYGLKKANQELNETVDSLKNSITEYIVVQNELLTNVTAAVDEIKDKKQTIEKKNEIIEELKLKDQQTVSNLTYLETYSINLQQTIDETNETTILLGETIEELKVNLTLAIEENDNLKVLLNSNLQTNQNQTNELQQKLVATESFLKTYKHSLYLSGLVLIAVMISFIVMELKHKKSTKSELKSASVEFVKGDECNVIQP